MLAELEDVKKLLQKKIDEYGQDWISTEEGSDDHLQTRLQAQNLRKIDDSMTSRASSMFVEVGDLQTNEYLSETEN